MRVRAHVLVWSMDYRVYGSGEGRFRGAGADNLAADSAYVRDPSPQKGPPNWEFTSLLPSPKAATFWLSIPSFPLRRARTLC
jgi:hypothetical protein